MTLSDPNPISGFRLSALLLGTLMLAPMVGVCAENVVQTAGAVTWVSGGGDDASLDQLKATSRNYNLKMVFALKSGAFMSDVSVAIVDAKGDPVLDTRSEGPWLLVKLPAGSYRILATASGNSIRQNVTVASGKLRTLDFRWPTE